jgi:DNA-binding transcriptional MerR regulator
VTTYKLDELAAATGVSARTIRYYVQRGLLPAPDFRGKDTAYGREHLARLEAIRALQAAHLSLEEIQARLTGRSLAEIGRVAAHPASAAPGGSAPAAPASLPSPARERWERIVLAEGVELHVRSDAPEASRELARAALAHLTTAFPSKETR